MHFLEHCILYSVLGVMLIGCMASSGKVDWERINYADIACKNNPGSAACGSTNDAISAVGTSKR